MSFVRGHPRDTGWVVGHLRAPTDAQDGQLPLVAVLPAADRAGSADGGEATGTRPADGPEAAGADVDPADPAGH